MKEEQISTLGAFHRALQREAHILKSDPDLLWQQLFNRLQWEAGENREGPLSNVLDLELKIRTSPAANPWFQNTLRIKESKDLIRTLEGHSARVNSCAFSPDGLILASASEDNTIRLWEPDTGETIKILTGHTDSVNDCAFSPDGAILASASSDHSIRFWDVSSGKQKVLLSGHTGVVNSISFSTDGQMLVSGSGDHAVRLWSVQDGEVMAVFTGHTDPVTCCAISPDCQTIVSVGFDKPMGMWASLGSSRESENLKFWRIKNGENLVGLQGGSKNINYCSLSTDGKTMVTTKPEGLTLWNFLTREILSTMAILGGASTCTFSPDGLTIAAGGKKNNEAHLLDIRNNKISSVFSGHAGQVFSCAYSPDGRMLATASGDKTLRLWEIPKGTDHLETLDHPKTSNSIPDSQARPTKITPTPTGGSIYDIIYKREEERLRSAPFDPSNIAWDKLDQKISNKDKDRINAAAYALDMHWLAVASDSTLRLWNVKKGQVEVLLKGHTQKILSCAFCPNTPTLATASSDNTIRLWDLQVGFEKAILLGHRDDVNHCCYAPDGRKLASASNDGTVRLWNTLTKKEISILEGHRSRVTGCAFSPDGRSLASVGLDNTIRIWDAGNGKQKTVIHNLTTIGQETDLLKFLCSYSPDGRTLIAFSNKGMIPRLWDIESYLEKNPRRAKFTQMAFSPSEEFLAIVKQENNVSLWNPETGATQGNFYSNGAVTSLAFSPTGSMLAIGDAGGNLYNLALRGFKSPAVMVTGSNHWPNIGVICPFCHNHFKIKKERLGTEITCLNEGCKALLKLNSFVIKRPKKSRSL